MPNIYPYTPTPAFMTWALPESGMHLWAWHNGRCAMCGHTSQLVEDHCHVTGMVRGLLCSGCNFSESGSHHAAWLAWRAGRNPATLLDVSEEYMPPFGAEATDSIDRRAAAYVRLVERCAVEMGQTLVRPFTWAPAPPSAAHMRAAEQIARLTA